MHPILARRGRLQLYLLAWLPLALGLVALFHVAGPLSWDEAAALGGPLTAVYAFVCLAAAYPCRTIPISAATLSRIVAGQALAAVLSAALWLFLATNWVVLLEQVPAWAGITDRFARALPAFLAAGVLMYAMAAAVHYLVLASERARELERRHLELSLLAREAELKALRAQLDPHFMFNALNSISALTTADPAGARRMCIALADLLRDTLRLGREPAIPLGDELALADRYLDIERTRFGSRLSVEHAVAPGLDRLEVPPLILQPLVENAVRHGVSRLLKGGTVTIEARREGSVLRLAVANPVDETAAPAPGTGIGLENVRARLAALPGDRASLEVTRGGGRFRVELAIPLGAVAEVAASLGDAAPTAALATPEATS